MPRLLKALSFALLVVLVWPAAAPAHESGKAEPRIRAGVSDNQGLVRILTVQLTDLDSGEQVRGATVTAAAEMTSPHLMKTSAWSLAETSAGTYEARVKFPMAASWEISVEVTGEKVVAASSRFPVQIEQGAGTPPPASAGVPDLTTRPTQLEDELGRRDIASMAVLWTHSVAALGWIVGVIAMAIALSTRPGVLAEGMRTRLADGYRRWGAWLHWGVVPVIVWTGVYNMLYVTPFPIAWRPSQFDELADVPYGLLYEAILVVKLGLFAALLITGTQLLLRTVRPRPPVATAPNPEAGFVRTLASALGPPGIFYLATVPLIIGAAMSLRYVHVLSHVAEVVSGS